MDSAKIIAFQAVVMFILLFFGYFLYKKKMLSDESTKQLSAITLTIVNPIVIFNSYLMDFNVELLKGLAIAFGLAVVAHLALIAASMIAVRKSKPNYMIERFAMIYANCGFMGIPLVKATFGDEGVFYLTGFITVFNLFMWTHGTLMMSGQRSAGFSDTAKSIGKVLLSPAIIAIAIGMVFFFSGLRLPSVVQTPLDYIGSLNTPLAMIVSGATIAKAGLLRGFKCGRVYYVQLFKLLLVPALLTIAYVPLVRLGVSATVINTILIASAAPTASATIMFSYKHGRDEAYASGHFAVSTIASMATMPIILLLSALIMDVVAR
ncbi:MAG: AEC family transporter [Ruminococcaceae bacterium]|nr:AEC family transporter [Oscillospiraceae bacterium]